MASRGQRAGEGRAAQPVVVGDIEIGEVIGAGAFGTVHECIERSSGKHVSSSSASSPPPGQQAADAQLANAGQAREWEGATCWERRSKAWQTCSCHRARGGPLALSTSARAPRASGGAGKRATAAPPGPAILSWRCRAPVARLMGRSHAREPWFAARRGRDRSELAQRCSATRGWASVSGDGPGRGSSLRLAGALACRPRLAARCPRGVGDSAGCRGAAASRTAPHCRRPAGPTHDAPSPPRRALG